MKKKLFAVLVILLCSLSTVVAQRGLKIDLTQLMGETAPEYRFGPWSGPVNLGPSINSSSNDATGNLSKDGLTLYFTSTRSPSLGEDIWFTTRADLASDWNTPINLGPVVNSASMDRLRSVSADGKIILFQSNRPGTIGGNDIWITARKGAFDDTAWSVPVNLGSVINTEMNEVAANFFFGTERRPPQLMFSSGRAVGFGGADIYMSTVMPDGSFSVPLNLAELNSPSDDSCLWIRDDGLEIFFSSTRPDPTNSLNSNDIWVSTRSSVYEIWSPPQNLGPKFNVQGSLDVNPQLSGEGTIMLFTSNRPGGYGGNDLYMSTRRRLRSF